MKKIILSKAITKTTIALGAIGVAGGAGIIAYKGVQVSAGTKKLDDNSWSLGGQLGYSETLVNADETNWRRNPLSLNEEGKVNYLALGDSVSAGYDAWRDIDGYGYPDFIKDELSARGKIGTFDRHTFTGITAEDLSSIIQGDMTEENWDNTLNDHKYTDMPKYQKLGEHKTDDKHKAFSNFSVELDEKIKNANLITLNMGANDILGGIMVFGISLHDLMNPIFLKKKNLVPESIEPDEAMGYFVSEKVKELQAKGIPYILQHINEIINIDKQELGKIIVNVGGYVNGTLAKIRRINPEANIVVAGYYNPLVNFGLISQLTGLDGLIENLNMAIKNASYTQNIKNGKYNVIFTDMSKMTDNLTTSHGTSEVKSDSLAEGETYGIAEAISGVDGSNFIPHVLDIHPSLKGSIMMGKLIMNDYSWLTHAPATETTSVNKKSSFEDVISTVYGADFTEMKKAILETESAGGIKFSQEFVQKFLDVYSYDMYEDLQLQIKDLEDDKESYDKGKKEYDDKKIEFDKAYDAIMAKTEDNQTKYDELLVLLKRNQKSPVLAYPNFDDLKVALGGMNSSNAFEFAKNTMFNDSNNFTEGSEWNQFLEKDPSEDITHLTGSWNDLQNISPMIKEIPIKPSDSDRKMIENLFKKGTEDTLFQKALMKAATTVLKTEEGSNKYLRDALPSYVGGTLLVDGDATSWVDSGIDFSKFSDKTTRLRNTVFTFRIFEVLTNPSEGVDSLKGYATEWDSQIGKKVVAAINNFNGLDGDSMIDELSTNNGGFYLFKGTDPKDLITFGKFVFRNGKIIEENNNGVAPSDYGSTNVKASRTMSSSELASLDDDKSELYITTYEEISKRALPSNGNEEDDRKYSSYKIGSVYVNSFQLIAEGLIKSLVNSIVKSVGSFAKRKIQDTLATYNIISKDTIGEDAWAQYVSMQGIYSHEDPLYVLLNIIVTNLGEEFSTSITDKRTLIEVLFENLNAAVVGTMKEGIALLQTFMTNSNVLNAMVYPVKKGLIPMVDEKTDPTQHLYSKAMIGLTADMQGWIHGMNYAENRLDNTRRFWKNIYSFNLFGFNLATKELPVVTGKAIDGILSDNWAESSVAMGGAAAFIVFGTDNAANIDKFFKALDDMKANGTDEDKAYAEKKIAELKSFGVIDKDTAKSAPDGFKAGWDTANGQAEIDLINKEIGQYLKNIFLDKDNDQGIYYPLEIYAPTKA